MDATLSPVRARVLYQHPETTRTLVRNGKIIVRRDTSGSDNAPEGLHLVPVEVDMHDARRLPQAASLEREGFSLEQASTSLMHSDFYDEDQIIGRYYEECKALVKQVTGAKYVSAFDHNVRTAHGADGTQHVGQRDGRTIKGGNSVQGAAYVVHSDYTLTSAPDRLVQLGQPPLVNDTLHKVLGNMPPLSKEAVELGKCGRFMIVNVWRPITDTPVEVVPLGMCDSRTVTKDDLSVLEVHYSDRIGENYFAAHNSRHKWYYYPKMERSEAILLKTWDTSGSAADGGAFSIHSAFQDPTARPGAPPRESIEVRLMVVIDEGTTAKL